MWAKGFCRNEKPDYGFVPLHDGLHDDNEDRSLRYKIFQNKNLTALVYFYFTVELMRFVQPGRYPMDLEFFRLSQRKAVLVLTS